MYIAFDYNILLYHLMIIFFNKCNSFSVKNTINYQVLLDLKKFQKCKDKNNFSGIEHKYNKLKDKAFA